MAKKGALIVSYWIQAGEGGHELRVPVGPGYRVYYLQTGEAIYVLLVGGDKSSQRRDIATAKQMAAVIRREP